MTATQLRYEAEVLRQWSVHPTDGAHDPGHLRRVWQTAQRLAETEPCDRKIS